ncbi:MAG: alpha-galactosidase [Spirochaetes bacterium]|nr:alpha-galactosidase [Spirochaetota bacterium]
MGGVNLKLYDNINYGIKYFDNGDFIVKIFNKNEKLNKFTLFNLNDLLEYFKIEFEKKDDLYFFSNGFQSWSITKEYKLNEKYEKLALLKVFNKFVLRDRTFIKNRNNLFYSNYFTYFRIKNKYIALLFLPLKTPPAIFYFNKRTFEISVDFLFNYLDDLNEGFLGDLLIFYAEGFFEFKEKLIFYRDKMDIICRFTEILKNNKITINYKYIIGWESWYNHYSHINREIILNNLENLLKTENIFTKLINKNFINKNQIIFQIDDGWEVTVGEWEVRNDRFPEGMKYIADKIKDLGLIPGIWIAPFVLTRFSKIYKEKFEWVLKDENGIPVVAGFIPTPEWGNQFYILDLSIKEVQDYLKEVFNKLIIEWGYKFLKLDFLYAGLIEGNFKNGKSAYVWYENALNLITSYDAIFLGCGVPLQTSSNYFHINRIGADVKEKWDENLPKLIRHQGRPSAYISLINVLNRSIFDKVFYFNDPDVFFTRNNNIELSYNEKELIALANFLFGSQLMISDDLFDQNNIDLLLIDKIIYYFEKLKDFSFGNVRINKDIYLIFSKNFEYIGCINLRNSDFYIKIEDFYLYFKGFFGGKFIEKFEKFEKFREKIENPLINNFKISNDKLFFSKHSISLF